MGQYKQKTKQYVVNSAKQPIYIHRDDYILFNLNSCFVKKNNYVRFQSMLEEAIDKGGSKLNLCNLASLCYKIEMDYASLETYEFIEKLVEIISKFNLKTTQDNIESFGEIDIRPLDSLISFDSKANVIYTNSVLIECLKILGYADSQLTNVIDFTKDLKNIIPEDLIDELPITSKRTMKAYNKMKALLC